MLVYKYPLALKVISGFMRHPDSNIKVSVALTLSSINKFHKLPSEF